MAKHGNRASTSKSGSAEVLASIQTPNRPRLEAITGTNLARVYERTNYAFLFAPNFHTGLRHVAGIRKELPGPTIFNLLGPLTNPAAGAVEASLIGVKSEKLVAIFAEALRLSGAQKGMVVCGYEGLDEISCAGPTHCARLFELTEANGDKTIEVEIFALHPHMFGLPPHPLSTVSPGLTPEANAAILMQLLSGQLSEDHPILHFVLMNAAAMLVVSGACDAPDGRISRDDIWMEGVRLARLAISSGRALENLKAFADATYQL